MLVIAIPGIGGRPLCGASLSLSADFRFMIATVGGYFQHDSRIPGVENPQRTPFAGFTTNAPARVKFDSGLGYGGYLVFRVPLVVGL